MKQSWWFFIGLLVLVVIYDASAVWGGILLVIFVFGMLAAGAKNGVLNLSTTAGTTP